MTRSTTDHAPPKADDYWAAFDGIPLCHTPKTPQEQAELERKGACTCVG